MKAYHIPTFCAFSEEDNYERGCEGGGSSYVYDHSFDAASEEALIGFVCNHFDVERDAIELNACEEDGRIDIARMEDANGCNASQSEIESWKKGKTRLWHVVYTGQLEIKTAAKFTI